MRVKGENKIVFEVPDSVATALIAAGHLTEVTSHAAPEGDASHAAPEGDADQPPEGDAGQPPGRKPARGGKP